MKQPKAAFVSVLKPADDVRMFRKLALTFAQAGFQIHSLGYQCNRIKMKRMKNKKKIELEKKEKSKSNKRRKK
jgi:hypothetical protein